MAEETGSCALCGAMMGDVAKHQAWHDRIDAVESTADDALERAEQAQNVLYQNNIQV